MNQNLDRVREFARSVRGDLAARPEPATKEAAARAGTARAPMLAKAQGLRTPERTGARYRDQARALVRGGIR